MNQTRAMTLVEVLGALAILVVLSGGIIGFFLQVTERRDRLVRLAAQQRDTAMLLDRLEAAIMTAVTVAPDGSAGLRGDDRSIALVARGVSAVVPGDGALADAARVEFTFDEERSRCTCTLTPLAGADGPLSEPLLEHVERVRLRYSDGRAWAPTFDSLSAGALPVAVEVSVWLESGAATSPAGRPRDVPADAAPAEDDLLPSPDEAPGPLDLPPPELGEEPQVPREPDHLRVILVPDAPAIGWGGPPS